MDDNQFKILIIDDNPSIHHDFIKILKTAESETLNNLGADLFGEEKSKENFLPQFEIDVASQGEEGVNKINAALKANMPFALAFVDIRMPPGWDGIETIKKIWEVDKNIQIVICTAYSDYSWEETIGHLGKTDNLLILKKPFDNISVGQLASALTMKWKLAEQSRNHTELLNQQVADRTNSLANSLSLIKSTFESSSDGIIIMNDENKIIDYNNKLIDLPQIPKNLLEERAKDKFYKFLFDQLQDDTFSKKYAELEAHPDEISIDVLKFKNDKVFECYSQPHKLNDKIIGRILDFRDITKRAKLEEELQYQATHDSLTGLSNRIELHTKIREAIKTAKEDNGTFAVLFIDLDRFKLINDSLSHAIGDKLLKIASERLSSILSSQDTLARLGGDEFVILLCQKDNAKKQVLEAQINKIIDVFHQPFHTEDRQITLTASIGICTYPQDGITVDILLRNADTAMYRAKKHKGNNYQFYSSEMSQETLGILNKEMELRVALEKNEFFLCYQPQIDIESAKLTGVEALLRWRHPTKGILLPIDFIPMAEETGLIVPIGEWVLKAACQQNKAWQTAGFPPISVGVNITEQQFRQYNFVSSIDKTLKETGLNPKYLDLELTENVILSNPDIVRTITKLKELGLTITVDDFGTGYSSLSYLQKMPLDRLKIDGAFIKNISTEKDDQVIMRALLAIAKNLDLKVLAQGVETTAQLNFLKNLNCDDIQGFYFSEPLNTNEVEHFFKEADPLKLMRTEVKSKTKEK